MATPQNLMGLGLSPMLARTIGIDVIFVTAAGSTLASAKQIPGQDALYVVNATNTGACVAIPLVGGDGPANGALLGDTLSIVNICGSTVTVYANANAAGSAVTMYGQGVSTAGTTGVSVLTGWNMVLSPISPSTWTFFKGSA